MNWTRSKVVKKVFRNFEMQVCLYAHKLNIEDLCEAEKIKIEYLHKQAALTTVCFRRTTVTTVNTHACNWEEMLKINQEIWTSWNDKIITI